MTTLKPTTTPSVAQILEEDDDDEGAGDSEDEIGSIDGWLTRSHSQRQFATVLKPSKSSSSLPVSMQPIIRMGWMEKRGDINKSWKQRWFILRGPTLTYHKDSESAMKGETLGSLLMPGATIELDLITGEFDPTRDLALRTFGVKTLHSERVYAFRAPTKQDRTAWISVLETARGTPGAAAAAAADAAAQSAAAKPAKASRWQYDELCYGCRAEFTLIKRRHHCRRCGHAHCNDCSKQKCRIPESGFDSLVRVCDDCYSQLVAPPPRQKTAAEKEEERDALARLQLLKQMEQERMAAAVVEKEKNSKSKSKDVTTLATSPSSHIEKSPLDPEFDSDEEREKERSRSPKSLDSLSPTTSFSSRMRGGTTLNGYTDGKFADDKQRANHHASGGRGVSASVLVKNNSNNNSRSRSQPTAVKGVTANDNYNPAPNVLHHPPPPPQRTASPFTGRNHMSMNATGDDSYVAMSDDDYDDDEEDFSSESDDDNEDYASRRAKDQRRRERRKKKKKSVFCCFG